jgi:hypothetical protein
MTIDPEIEPGSKPLKPTKNEMFAQRVAAGVAPVDAYEAIGYSRNPGNASRLASRQPVADRIEWLQEQSAKAMVFDVGWIKSRMGALADALTEIRIDPLTGNRVKGPLYNASAGARVLELLGREAGIFKDKIELGGQVEVHNTDLLRRMKPEQRQAMRGILVEALKQAPEPANDDAPAEEAAESGVVPKIG